MRADVTRFSSLTKLLCLILLTVWISACGARPKPQGESQPEPQTKLGEPQEASKTGQAKSKDPDVQEDKSSQTNVDSESSNASDTQLLQESYSALVKVQEYVNADQLEDAVMLLKKRSIETPNIPEIHYNLGVLSERSGAPQAARESYERAIEIKSDFTPAWLALARFALRSNQAQSVLPDFESKLQRDPSNIGIKNARNRLLISLKIRLRDVVDSSKSILKVDEQNTPAMINLATAFAIEGKHELVLAILENAKVLDPKNPEVYIRLAESQLALSYPIKARLTLEEALSYGGGSAEIHNRLGLIYHKSGDYPGAAEQFSKALSLWPQMIEAQINLGNALKGQLKFDEASSTFQQALSIRPGLPSALYNLGILYMDAKFDGLDQIKQLERAIEYLEQFKGVTADAGDQEDAKAFIIDCGRRIKVINQERAMEAESDDEEDVSETEPGLEGEPGSEDVSETEPGSEDTSEAEPESEDASEPRPEADVEPEPSVEAEPEPSVEAEPEPRVKTDSQKTKRPQPKSEDDFESVSLDDDPSANSNQSKLSEDKETPNKKTTEDKREDEIDERGLDLEDEIDERELDEQTEEGDIEELEL